MPQFHKPSSDLGIAEQGLREIADPQERRDPDELRTIARETLVAMGLDWTDQ